MSEKLFTVAGVATDTKSNTRVRYANNLEIRTKVFLTAKYTNVHLVELNDSYDKFEACQVLLAMSEFAEYRDIIEQEIERIKRIDDEFSVKMYKKQRKLALANITAEDVLNFIK
jgi:transcriptional regulator NrdR family protein